MLKNVKFLLVLCIIGSFILFSCKPADLIEESIDYIYKLPVQRADGWEIESIKNLGIEEASMGKLMDKIKAGTYNDVNSVLIVKNGKLAFEEYFAGTNDKNEYVEYDWDVLHHQASVTKSIVSGLTGIALDLNLIESVNNPIPPYFTEYGDISWENNKDTITIKNLLTMTSGLYYDESSSAIGSMGNSHYQMNHSQDPIKYVLDQPMKTDPNIEWNYSSGNTVLLGRIIKKCTGIYIDKFAEKYLFKKLKITDYTWNDYETGDIRAHGGLALRPRDMAKFGQLYLNRGKWKERQVIPETWVTDSIKNQIPEGDYGYSWWLYRAQINNTIIDYFAAVGWGGQYIFIFPSINTLVVLTNGNFYGKDYSFTMLENHIIPAIF